LLESPPSHADDGVGAVLAPPRREDGLTHPEAAARLAAHGPNRLAAPPRRSAWRRFADQFRSVLVGLLAAAAVVAWLLGDVQDPIVIGVVLVLNAGLGFVQEGRAERAMRALAGMVVARARVRRDGAVHEIPATEVVPGDVVLLEAGDRVPADGRVLLAASLAVDESMLTGESVPAPKSTEPVASDAPLAERSDALFMNTVVVRGRAELLVTATGMATEIGRIAGLLADEQDRSTPLDRQLHRVGTRLAMVAAVAVAVVFTLELVRGDSFSDALLESVALAVAAVPEGLPAVVTLTLALGVRRLAAHNAIVKRLSSVETLGSTTVICSDKTGTLTLNEMTSTEIVQGDRVYRVHGRGYDATAGGIEGIETAPPALRAALEVAVLCNDAVVRDAKLIGDPTEGALVVLAEKGGVPVDHVRADRSRRAELPFDSAAKFMATRHPFDERNDIVGVKGAPEIVLDRCREIVRGDGSVAPLDAAARDAVAAHQQALAAEGRRVLAVASRVVPADSPLATLPAVDDLRLDALVAIVDPPREEAREAIARCGHAGIAVKMITGDHADTATAVARELGLAGRTVTGADLDAMSDEDLDAEIDDIGVCARVSPEHKVRIVRALRDRGHVVAMTGDGVNDAAALRAADIGVAMGITGTEVTKEAADLVLTDDDFGTIVRAVRHGRSIYDNIVTFVRFQLATNVAAILTIVGAGLLGLPSPFTPLQVLFVNLIADGPPAMALALDPPQPGVMHRRPHGLGAPILSASRLVRLLFLGAVMAVGTLTVLAVTDARADTDVAATMAFTVFVSYQLWNTLNARAERSSALRRSSLRNWRLWAALGAVALVQVAVVQVSSLRDLFDTVPLDATQWAICALAGATVVAAEEVRKVLARDIRPTGEGATP
jgi:Ca2+-transporting ATPase